MSTYTYTIKESGDTIEGWIADLRELSGPPHKATVKFEALLEAAYRHTQEATHIITGSLKASGRSSSDFDGEVWEGTIEYGGALWRAPIQPPGEGKPNDPVLYAIYEMARGGEHDFFGGLPFFEDKMGEIIDSLFPG